MPIMNPQAIENSIEAEQYHLKATIILGQLQANKKVFGSNSAITGASPANIEMGLQYINRSIELIPDHAVYLNLKALLLWEGMGQKEQAMELLEKAAAIKPNDIDIQNNLKAIKTSQCAIATAAFGTPLALEVHILRWWRDEILMPSKTGRFFVAIYYRISSPAARFINKYRFARAATRLILSPIILKIKTIKEKPFSN